MNKQYYYGIVFWNEKTDEEVNTYFLAESFFQAEKQSLHLPKGDNWIEGVLHFIGEDHKGYDTPLFSFVNPK
jgi:hypothetical protein